MMHHGEFSPIKWRCGRYLLDINRPLIMSVVNVTPDSFSGDGLLSSLKNYSDIEAHLSNLVELGADIIDIGGESTRPGTEAVSEQEELDRVMPFLEVAVGLGVPVSVDTYKPSVMKHSIALGVDIINDISALRGDGALDVVSHSSVGVVLMHMQGNPSNMQLNPVYANVVGEVLAFLRERVEVCLGVGVSPDRLCIDPGIGFGKLLEHNLELLSGLRDFVKMRYPVLVGPSLKSYLGLFLGRNIRERLYGTISSCLAACCLGAHIVRVHDVSAVRDALIVWKKIIATGWGDF
ncbi:MULTISPECIES: dihydropteroate synthase [Candidatus Ichthyocystis]|uniref:dihydropteroate synthase n=1 Tax=Candidatus Ichthyocystis TaxID=2929841 RepID=UPI000A59F165|nr:MULTISPECIES: dihydropteroate synthase [Ichthyocystis]